MSNNYGPKIVTDGLVLCLDAADQNSYSGSGNTWIDASANNNNATLYNSPIFVDANGGYIDFDGTNDYADTANGTSLNNSLNISVEMWINQDVIHTSATFTDIINLFEIPANALIGSESCFYMGIRSSGVFFRYQKGAGAAQTASVVGGQETNVWRHYVGTSDDNYISIYKDGELIQSNANQHTFTAMPNTIGRLAECGYYSNHYNGKIAAVKVYNKALAASEVRQNFEATKGRFGL